MADTVQEFDKLARELEALDLGAPAAAAKEQVDVCGTWQVVKPFVSTGIKILSLLPFGWAKKLSGALELLAKALNTFCPA
jgi:hypothetical protein